jgi:hypothetical protein
MPSNGSWKRPDLDAGEQLSMIESMFQTRRLLINASGLTLQQSLEL